MSTVRGLRMFAEGTPDSHQERKWTRQGHDPAEFAGLRERERAGWLRAQDGNTDMGEIDAVVSGVRCPVHDAARGEACPGEPGVCEARVRKWVLARGQRTARSKQRAAVRRKDRAPVMS